MTVLAWRRRTSAVSRSTTTRRAWVRCGVLMGGSAPLGHAPGRSSGAGVMNLDEPGSLVEWADRRRVVGVVERARLAERARAAMRLPGARGLFFSRSRASFAD